MSNNLKFGVGLIFIVAFLGIVLSISYYNMSDTIKEISDENEFNRQENFVNENVLTEQVRTKIEEWPQKYGFIQAIEDKCVVSVHGRTIYNKDELDEFLEKVGANEPYFIRCIGFTTEGDMLITDVNFEGNDVFSTCFDLTRDKYASRTG